VMLVTKLTSECVCAVRAKIVVSLISSFDIEIIIHQTSKCT